MIALPYVTVLIASLLSSEFSVQWHVLTSNGAHCTTSLMYPPIVLISSNEFLYHSFKLVCRRAVQFPGTCEYPPKITVTAPYRCITSLFVFVLVFLFFCVTGLGCLGNSRSRNVRFVFRALCAALCESLHTRQQMF